MMENICLLFTSILSIEFHFFGSTYLGLVWQPKLLLISMDSDFVVDFKVIGKSFAPVQVYKVPGKWKLWREWVSSHDLKLVLQTWTFFWIFWNDQIKQIDCLNFFLRYLPKVVYLVVVGNVRVTVGEKCIYFEGINEGRRSHEVNSIDFNLRSVWSHHYFVQTIKVKVNLGFARLIIRIFYYDVNINVIWGIDIPKIWFQATESEFLDLCGRNWFLNIYHGKEPWSPSCMNLRLVNRG